MAQLPGSSNFGDTAADLLLDFDNDLDTAFGEVQLGRQDSDEFTSSSTSTAAHAHPSPGSDEELDELLQSSQMTSTQPSASKKPAKRKRENRYKNAPPAVITRRRAQNRASQKAYRERKDQRIKDLEQLLDDAKKRNDVLSEAYAQLQNEYIKLTTSPIGNDFDGANMSFQGASSALLASSVRLQQPRPPSLHGPFTTTTNTALIVDLFTLGDPSIFPLQ